MEPTTPCQCFGRPRIEKCYITAAEISHPPCSCERGRYYRGTQWVCIQCGKVLAEKVEIGTYFGGDFTQCIECDVLSPDTWDMFFIDTA